MIAAFDLLLAVAGILVLIFAYKWLIHSSVFSEVVDDLAPPPETADDLISTVDDHLKHADSLAADLDADAAARARAAEKLRNYTKPYGSPRRP